MKIVVLDGRIEQPYALDWSKLAALGELYIHEAVPSEAGTLISAVGDAEVAVVNKVDMNADVIAGCPNLKMITVLATGYNIIDVDAASARGIAVCNLPSYGTEAVTQHAIALLLELTNRVGRQNAEVHAGGWVDDPLGNYWECPYTELAGKTLGVFGFGRIGRQVGRIASALGMRVIACSRTETEEGRKIANYVNFEALLRESDVLSLNCPLTRETQRVIDGAAVKRMKPGAILLNVSRGGLVEEQAVADALRSGKLAGAAVDVVSEEPIRADNPLLSAPNCIITPHTAWAAYECRQRILDLTADNVCAFAGGHPIHVVNP